MKRLATAAISACMLLGCTQSGPAPQSRQNDKKPASPADPKSASDELAQLKYAGPEAAIGPEVQAFCSRCHSVPEASEAPREAWRQEVEFAYGFHKASPAKDEPAPDMDAVVDYFESKAIPYADLVVPPLGDSDPGGVKFTRIEVAADDVLHSPALGGLTWLPPREGHPGALFACEMRSGGLYQIRPAGLKEAIVTPESNWLSNPCHVEPCDLDGDGITDLVVADLGNFYPSDHAFGRVVWLRRKAADGGYEPVELGGAFGRVADVRPGDFDGDGDQDLVVAEFGLYKTGRIVLLENQGGEAGQAKFALRQIDSRHGTIHVPVTDLNGDGRLDFVALISQEHEVIEAFLNRGDGTFEKRAIYKAPNPSWGSSGIQLCDLDGDDDLDLIYTNGDSFDREYLKPYHGIRWLENQGDFPWVEHHLADLPGCECAQAGDLDGDGDLDIVAASLTPVSVLERFGEERFDGICWFEQTAPGQFHRRSLERGACSHPALSLGDFDGDGDLDLAVGEFDFREAPSGGARAFLTIWRNDSEPSGKALAPEE